MSVNDVIGHERIINQIIKAIELGKLAHAHLFVGEDGIGKSIIAKKMALKILGEDRNIQYADLIEWKVAKNRKSLGVEDIRDLIEEINKKPYEGENKVVVVYQADKMTIQAQNAFLKTIEEPPKGVYLILLCENLELVLDTIRSRCQIHKLKSLACEEITLFLMRRYNHLSKDDVKVITAFCDGIPGRAESFLEDETFKDIRNKCLCLLKDINIVDNEGILGYEEFLVKHKDKWSDILSTLLSYIRDIMIYKETGGLDLLINVDKMEDIKELSNMFSFTKLSGIIKVLDETRERLDRNLNPSLVFDLMLMKIQEV